MRGHVDNMVKRGFLEEETLKMGLEGYEGWVVDEGVKAWGRKEQSVGKELPDKREACEHRAQVWRHGKGLDFAIKMALYAPGVEKRCPDFPQERVVAW